MPNKEEGWTGKDIWFKQIDWFDVGVFAVVGGITGGYTAEYKAAQALGTNVNSEPGFTTTES